MSMQVLHPLFLKEFLIWTIFLKCFIEFIALLLFYALFFFGHKAHGILAPYPGIKPTPPAMEGKMLTTGQPGESSFVHF